MRTRLLLPLVSIAVVLGAGGALAGGGIALTDANGGSVGSAKVNLAKGSVKLKLTLNPLPATIATGADTFTAHLYKSYLTNSSDPAVEISLGDVYPSSKSKASQKVAMRGDCSQMGLDRVVVTAFSKDGLRSFDIATGTIAP